MKKRNLPKRVDMETRLNGIYHEELRKKGPRASIEQDKKKIIPRRRKHKGGNDDYE